MEKAYFGHLQSVLFLASQRHLTMVTKAPLAGSGAGMRQVVKPKGPFPLIVFVALIVIISFCLIGIVNAHGGGLDGSGGHNCYVGSCAGTYHYHSGGSKTGGGFNFLWLIVILMVGGYFLDARREKKQREEIDNSFNEPVIGHQQDEIAATDPERVEQHSSDLNDDIVSSSYPIEEWLLDEIDMAVLAEEYDDNEMPENEWHEWKRFKSLHEDGDIIRVFSSPQDYWNSLCGSAGYALIRNDQIVTTIITEEN